MWVTQDAYKIKLYSLPNPKAALFSGLSDLRKSMLLHLELNI